MNNFMSCKMKVGMLLRLSPLVLKSIIVSNLCSSFKKNLQYHKYILNQDCINYSQNSLSNSNMRPILYFDM